MMSDFKSRLSECLGKARYEEYMMYFDFIRFDRTNGSQADQDEKKASYLAKMYQQHIASLLKSFGTVWAVLDAISDSFRITKSVQRILKELVVERVGNCSVSRIEMDETSMTSFHFENDTINMYLDKNPNVKDSVNKSLRQIQSNCTVQSLYKTIENRNESAGEEVTTILFWNNEKTEINGILSYSATRQYFREDYLIKILFFVTSLEHKPRGKDVIAQLIKDFRILYGSDVTFEVDSTLEALKFWYLCGFVVNASLSTQSDFWDWNPFENIYNHLGRGVPLDRNDYPFMSNIISCYLKYPEAAGMSTEAFRDQYYSKKPCNGFITVRASDYINRNTEMSLGKCCIAST